MNGKQAAKAAAKRIEEMEHTIAQYKQDITEYNHVIEDMISGKSPCSWCEDVGECILDANGSVGCTEWMLRFRKPGREAGGGELEGEEGKAAGTDLNPIFGLAE
jgi:hypothetical protein